MLKPLHDEALMIVDPSMKADESEETKQASNDWDRVTPLFFRNEENKRRNKLNDAINTIRKLGLQKARVHPNYEWPTKADLMRMVTDAWEKPIKVEAILWKGSQDLNKIVISNLGLRLSNGYQSPKAPFGMISEPVKPGNVVKIIRLKTCPETLCLEHIKLLSPQREKILKVQTRKSRSDTDEYKLDSGERLLGIYGHMDEGEVLSCAGFMVWRPPDFK